MFHFALGKLGAAIRAGTGSAGVVPLFSRDYEATGSLGADATFTRASTATVTDFEGLVKTIKSGEARFEGLRRVENLLSASLANFANWTVFKTGAASTSVNGSKVTLDSPTASDRVFLYTTLTLAVGEYILSFYLEDIEDLADLNDVLCNVGGGTATYSLSLVPVYLNTSAKRVRLKITVTAAGTVILRIGAGSSSGIAEHATYFDPMLEDVTGQTNQNPSEYVSVGVLSAPYHGANVDGVKYFATENGNTVTDNVVTEGTGAAITGGALLMEPAATNYLLNSGTPATQTTGSLGTGTYVLWVEGSGSAAVTAGTATITGGGTATDGTPDTFTVTGAGTVTVTVTGTLDRFQLEAGSTPTSYIPTSGSAVTRAADSLSYSGIAADNETRAITDAGTVDVDDWDGVVDATINGADNLAQISSITVYTTGERPA